MRARPRVLSAGLGVEMLVQVYDHACKFAEMNNLMSMENCAQISRKNIGYGWKVILLSIFGGFSLVGLFFTPLVLFDFKSGISEMERFGGHEIKEMFVIFGLGAAFTGIFGAPALWLIDKYFHENKFRYMVGGVFSGIFLWLIVIIPFFAFQEFPGRENQLSLIYFFGLICTLLGAIIGGVFSIVVWIFERRFIK